MQLTKLIEIGVSLEVSGIAAASVEVRGLTEDSREVEEGFLFAALQGTSVHGSKFIPEVIKKGAKVILTDRETAVDEKDVAVLRHENPRFVLGLLAAKFFGRQPEVIAAVTGTNGKTSTAHFIRQLWHVSGRQAASLGTLGLVKGMNTPQHDQKAMTTPDVVHLHKTLKSLQLAGITHLAMEASSHGLDQYRVAGAAVTIGAFTNFTRDHMDYHKTEEHYFDSKMKLFTEVLPKGSHAVLNADIPQYQTIKTICEAHEHTVIAYGKAAEGDLRLISITPREDGQEMHFMLEGKDRRVVVPLLGEFQISNLMCAMGVMRANGMSAEMLMAAARRVTPVTGRMEKVGTHASGATVYVDYAHTPDALAKVLTALRPHVAETARLIVLFGCGGDRDKGKRPQMGEIACRLADKVVVTDDNPRTENAATIRKEIMKACNDKAEEMAGREDAIKKTIKGLKKGDLLLLAGKGHEKYQIIGKETLPFDEVEIAGNLLEREE